MIGLHKHIVKLVPHEKYWHNLFESEKCVLHALLQDYILDIQHVGSTAIDGIKAKPIIDIAVLIPDENDFNTIVEILENNGYEYKGDAGSSGGELIVKCSAPDVRTHHIHFVRQQDLQWKNYLYFRDVLNTNPALAIAYNELKEELEKKFMHNRQEYTRAKNEFISRVLDKDEYQDI
jgi:GrpB-like predicted nucleotidyltransferase (UPF0157 family)